MIVEQKICEEKKFQLQSMSNAITCIDKRFADNNSSISCLTIIFTLSNQTLTILHTIFLDKYDESNTVFFGGSIRTYGLVIKASPSETGDRRIWVRFPQEAETLCSPSAILHGTQCTKKPFCVPTRALSYCCALDIFFLSWISSVVISHWQGLNS